MDTDVVPAGGGSSAPATRPGRPNAPAVAGPGRRAPAPLRVDLSAESVLDVIAGMIAALHADLQHLTDQLGILGKTSESLDMTIGVVDERCQQYEAPAITRGATDAASLVSKDLADLVAEAGGHAYAAQVWNAQAAAGLGTVLQVQDRQRRMGAGPRLLASAGR